MVRNLPTENDYGPKLLEEFVGKVLVNNKQLINYQTDAVRTSEMLEYLIRKKHFQDSSKRLDNQRILKEHGFTFPGIRFSHFGLFHQNEVL